jgi:hypothetical protein
MFDLNYFLERIIDLRYSKIDWEKSDKKKGQFYGPKVYYRTKGKKLSDCPYRFLFGPYDKEGTETNLYLLPPMSCEFVEPDDKDFIPDGIPPNAENHYQVGDVVLMKQPMKIFLQNRKERMDLEERDMKATSEKFKADAKQDGVHVDDEQLAKIMGIT